MNKIHALQKHKEFFTPVIQASVSGRLYACIKYLPVYVQLLLSGYRIQSTKGTPVRVGEKKKSVATFLSIFSREGKRVASINLGSNFIIKSARYVRPTAHRD